MKMNLPVVLLILLGIATLPQYSAATAVPEASIPSGIDWFAHLDADQLRATRAGATLFEELRSLDPLQKEANLPINPVLILDGLKGLTAFGTMPDFENNPENVDVVVLLSGEPALIQVFKGLISGMQLEQPEAIEEILHGDYTILSLKEAGVSGVFVDDGQIALSKSLVSMDKFLSVLGGKQESLKFGERFPVPVNEHALGVYLGVYIDGMDGLDKLPAQARILQLTQAVAVQLGESGDYLHLLASLVTDSEQTATQVSEVLKGVLAMLSLTQTGQADIAAIVNSAQIARVDKAVSLKVDYPVESAEAWIRMGMELARAQMAGEEEQQADADVEVEVGIVIDTNADNEPGADL